MIIKEIPYFFDGYDMAYLCGFNATRAPEHCRLVDKLKPLPENF
jgi:hypothetical protein